MASRAQALVHALQQPWHPAVLRAVRQRHSELLVVLVCMARAVAAAARQAAARPDQRFRYFLLDAAAAQAQPLRPARVRDPLATGPLGARLMLTGAADGMLPLAADSAQYAADNCAEVQEFCGLSFIVFSDPESLPMRLVAVRRAALQHFRQLRPRCGPAAAALDMWRFVRKRCRLR